jgi:hypothetical protein
VLPRPMPGLVLLSPLLLLIPKLATCGESVGPSPHAASTMAAAATRMASPPDRRYVLVMFSPPSLRPTRRAVIVFVAFSCDGVSCTKRKVTARSQL